jgi:hypothetical protein
MVRTVGGGAPETSLITAGLVNAVEGIAIQPVPWSRGYSCWRSQIAACPAEKSTPATSPPALMP